jgi:sulfur carrier protein ThiS
MDIFIEKKNKKLIKKFNGKARLLLKELKINSEEVLIVKNNMLITLEDTITDKDNIKILSVISGG